MWIEHSAGFEGTQKLCEGLIEEEDGRNHARCTFVRLISVQVTL